MDIFFVTYLVCASLIPVHVCKPVDTESKISLNNDHMPCHVVDIEQPEQSKQNITEENFADLVQRIDQVQSEINRIKDTIKNGGNILMRCAKSKFSHRNFTISCGNTTNITKQQMAECLIFSYKTINEFSESMKEMENYSFKSKGNLNYILRQMGDLKTYTDQLLCEMYIDLKILGHNSSLHQLSQKDSVSIFSDFIEQAKTIDSSACFHVRSELNQIQMIHVIYQFLENYFNIMQNMKVTFSSGNYSDITNDGIQEEDVVTQAEKLSTTTTETPGHDLVPIIFG